MVTNQGYGLETQNAQNDNNVDQVRSWVDILTKGPPPFRASEWSLALCISGYWRQTLMKYMTHNLMLFSSDAVEDVDDVDWATR